jgi:phosphoglycolate phosphatase-like HAD superfamily hydrolase
MTIKYLICDWNGTLIGFNNEKPLFQAIGKEIFKSALPFNVGRIVRMQKAKEQKKTGIFSAACKYPIEKVIGVAGYDKDFDFIEADQIYSEDGKAMGFGLSIYGHKHELIDEIFQRRNINPEEVAYIADTEDEAGCFEKVKYPVVSLLVSDELKNKFAREYKAFVPESIEDLDNYLNKA